MISGESKPRLASKARLRFDRKSSRSCCSTPSAASCCNETAADVLERCTGERTVDSIVEELAQKYGHQQHAVEKEVMDFLRTMADRGLVQSVA